VTGQLGAGMVIPPTTRAHFAARFFMYWLRNEHAISLTGGLYHYRAKFFGYAVLTYGVIENDSGRYAVDQVLLRRLSVLALQHWAAHRLVHFSPYCVHAQLEILMPYEQKLMAELVQAKLNYAGALL